MLLTIGHSTHPIDEFIDLLRTHGGTCVVDVRKIPMSRYNPQFNRLALESSLKQAGLGYVHMPGLGGLRRPTPDSPNVGWRNSSFRGYADYMQTPEFIANLEELIRLASHQRIAIMCAEAVPWRCHRSLISDALLVRGIEVADILNEGARHIHALTPFAEVDGDTITYPGERIAQRSLSFAETSTKEN